MTKLGREVVLNGGESAILVGALFALSEWPFRAPAAKEIVSRNSRDDALELSEAISLRWRQLLDEKGLWNSPAGRWTPDLIAQRALLYPALVIHGAERKLAGAALQAVSFEFADDWGEFCTVVPGAIQWYKVGLADVENLLARIGPEND